MVQSNLREYRIAMGLKQGELAEKVGLSRRSISNFENDQAPSLENALILSGFFQVPVNQLFSLVEKSG
ncbi:MAG: helix-turn-helix transcriptional regulator [Lachnospiraceae bacterium]|nr:helix-turn-helix transcriptional regulator [Lachnospiraceae bacterium]